VIDRVRTAVSERVLSPLRRYLARGSTSEASEDRPGGNRPGSPRKQSPEDHVLELLQESGGRMWQQRVVDETGYSEPHVSRLLCRLEDDGRIEREWIRGQKVVVLDGESDAAIGSTAAASG
jgi:uncharacterized membrane protein